MQALVPVIHVHDISSGRMIPVPFGGQGANPDPIATAARANGLHVLQTLQTRFGRDGWDGHNTPLQLVIHQQNPDGSPMDNAYWNGQAVHLGDGSGSHFAPLAFGLDVMAHEIGHAVISSEVQLSSGGEGGALHESFADVFAVMVDDDDWTIGEDVYTPAVSGDALRDMARPELASLMQLRGAPTSGVEVHLLAGVASLAAYETAQSLGRDAMGRIWYTALTQYMPDGAGFVSTAEATRTAAEALYGADAALAVEQAWAGVGVSSAKLPMRACE